MKVKLIQETNIEKFEEAINTFEQQEKNNVRATQTHVTSTPMTDGCYDLVYTAVIYYNEVK